MSAWCKPKPTTAPTAAWVKTGWGQQNPETLTKVSGCPPLLKQQIPPLLEYSNHPNKQYCSSKICTKFYTLPLDIHNNIETWHLSLLHHKKLKKVLGQLTQNNPLISSTRYYKPK